jgi:uncharacterized protein YecE (DUF72 family)
LIYLNGDLRGETPLNEMTPAGVNEAGTVKVGIAGWSYPDWKGLVFPRESNFDRVQYLAGYFDTLEINTSFYSIPAPRLVEKWLESARGNPRFSFCVKLYKQFTHGANLRDGSPRLDAQTAEAFKQAFRSLLNAGRLGALLIQFPYRFHATDENRDYLKRLLDQFREFPLVVEFRHKSFYQPLFLDFLRRENVAFANIDQPQISQSMPPTSLLTHAEIGYLRFHGRNSENWFAAEATVAERYDYDYSVEEFEKYWGMVREVQKKKGVLYIIFNNHYRAHQIKNALEFLHRLTGKPVQVMPKLQEAYPSLRSISISPVETKAPYTPSLFE